MSYQEEKSWLEAFIKDIQEIDPEIKIKNIQTKLPFWKAVTKAIERCNPDPSNNEIFNLLQLIKEIEIFSGHEEIIAAIEKYFNSSSVPEKLTYEIQETKNKLEQELDRKKYQSGNLRKITVDLGELLDPDRTSYVVAPFPILKRIHRLFSQAIGY